MMLSDAAHPSRFTSSDEEDAIWGEIDSVVEMQEWKKMDEDFTNAGYREGITAGKEGALQEGFDDGFVTVGAPIGRDVGILRGGANAVMSVLGTVLDDEQEERRKEVADIIRGLGRIGLGDVAPRDVEAEEHAREHLGDGGGGGDVSGREVAAAEELERLRMRLLEVLGVMGLDVSLV